MSVGQVFLTDLDPRLQVQGSRDALGSQGLWATIGRRLVGNLTLSSNDVAGFRTLLIGYGLPAEDADTAERLRVFLRWEQVAAAARVVTEDWSAPLGARRVRRRLAERSTMTVSEERDCQIFADQRSSGLWVLYHRAARASGLVDDRRRLTAAGHDLFDVWMPELPDQVIAKVRRGGPQRVTFGRVGAPAPESEQIADVLVRGVPADRPVLGNALVKGVVPEDAGVRRLADGCQEQLAKLMARTSSRDGWRVRVLDLLDRASTDAELSGRLTDVLVTESVLFPAQVAFDFLLLEGNGATTSKLGTDLTSAWPAVAGTVRANEFSAVAARELGRVLGARRTDAWTEAAEAMATGDWARTLERLVDINAATMELRGGAPWVRTTAAGSLDVRLPLGAPLLQEAEVTGGWRNPYYLFPLASVQRALRGRRW